MYRRERSGPFIVLTTFLIVVAMAVFTYIMWGMARRIDTITETILEGNENFKSMLLDMHSISEGMASMTSTMVAMNGTLAAMQGNVGQMQADMGRMSTSMEQMTGNMQAMTVSMNRMTLDVGRASYAFSNPMSYMFGNGFPF